jgi:hypothetical protein
LKRRVENARFWGEREGGACWDDEAPLFREAKGKMLIRGGRSKGAIKFLGRRTEQESTGTCVGGSSFAPALDFQGQGRNA